MLLRPAWSQAQSTGRVARIGTLDISSQASRAHLWAAFDSQLETLGYVLGRNVQVERRWADGKSATLEAYVKEIVNLKVDVIVAAGTNAALAAARATASIPLVFTNVAGDPVKIGLVTNFNRPEGNRTGNSSLSTDLSGKRLELMREILPRLQQIAVLWDIQSPSAEEHLHEVERIGRTLRLGVRSFGVKGAGELPGAFAGMRAANVDGVAVAAGGLFFSERKALVELALKHRLPTAFSVGEYAEAGGLMSYGPDLKEGMRRGAIYVDKILKGTRPVDLPVERPTKFELVINAATARVLGLKLSQATLIRADRVIG